MHITVDCHFDELSIFVPDINNLTHIRLADRMFVILRLDVKSRGSCRLELAEMYRLEPANEADDLPALQRKVATARALLEKQLPLIEARIKEGGATINDERAVRLALEALA